MYDMLYDEEKMLKCMNELKLGVNINNGSNRAISRKSFKISKVHREIEKKKRQNYEEKYFALKKDYDLLMKLYIGLLEDYIKSHQYL